jgi:hypothetical protein
MDTWSIGFFDSRLPQFYSCSLALILAVRCLETRLPQTSSREREKREVAK